MECTDVPLKGLEKPNYGFPVGTVFTYSGQRTYKSRCTITKGAKDYPNSKCNLAGFGRWDTVYDDIPKKTHFQSAQIAAEKFCVSDVSHIKNLGDG